MSSKHTAFLKVKNSATFRSRSTNILKSSIFRHATLSYHVQGIKRTVDGAEQDSMKIAVNAFFFFAETA